MKISRLGVVALAPVLLTLLALGGTAQGANQRALPKATQIMNWFPEPEHGGQYAAMQNGLYTKMGVDMSIGTFNPKGGNCEPLVATGRVDFCMDNADGLLQARQAGIPVVGVFTMFQINPQGIMWHAADTTMHGVADLSNHTFIYSFGAAYWDFMKAKYHYKNVKEQANDYSLQLFSANPKGVNQVYVTSEPFTAMDKGMKVKWALIADSGYNPYAQVMVTSEANIKQRPAMVRAFVQASAAGWKTYLANPEKVFTYIKALPAAKNWPMTKQAMRFSFQEIRDRHMVTGGAAKDHGIGYTNPQGMALLKKQMVSVGIKLDKVDVSKAFTNQFLAGM